MSKNIRQCCRHFTGAFTNEECLIGINYREITGGDDLGWGLRIPCTEKNQGKGCEKFESKTEEDIRKETQEWEDLINKMKIINPLANALKNKHERGYQGTVECPICNKDLHFSIAKSNGHLWMRCETEKCVHLIE